MRIRKSRHDRIRAAASAMSFSESDSCPHCRCRYENLQRHNSNHSAHSATTLNSYTSSSLRDPRLVDRYYAHLDDDPGEDSLDGVRVINEREMNSLHKTVPALRRHDVKTSTIRQHYYPEGGWGWIICGCGFLVHILTTGLQFSYGVLFLETVKIYGNDSVMDAAWIGVLCFAVSLISAPIVVALCRRKSTRLTAVFGGLVMALACLFTSFAQQLHQIFLSYGVVLGVGTCLVRESSGLMLAQYFKRRREFVEIVVQAGGGIGITLFSVFYKEAVGNIGWRLGLQAVTGVVFVSFFLGIFYRSASLYHPQRRAILHLKNQKKKVKEKKGHVTVEKPPFFDFSPLRVRAVQILLVSSGTSAVGLYTPIFYLVLQGYREGLEDSALVLLQTFLGFATALGCVGFGLVVVRPSDQCLISRQYLCQAAMVGVGVSLLALSTVHGYHGYVLFVWIYGIFLGGFLYSLKMYTFERVRARHFTRTWGFVQGAKAIPVLLGIPITGYINESNPKAGYYFSFFFTMLGAFLLFLMNWYKQTYERPDPSVSFTTVESGLSGDLCTCPPPPLDTPTPARARLPKSISFATTMEPPPNDLLGCISEEGLGDNYIIDYDFYGNCVAEAGFPGKRSLRQMTMSVSEPEGLARRDIGEPHERAVVGGDVLPHLLPSPAFTRQHNWQRSYRRPVRNITVIEQMTTSV